MTNEELLNCIKVLLERKLMKVFSGTLADDDDDLLFFGKIDKEYLQKRQEKIKSDGLQDVWFIITDWPFGSEYSDYLMDLGIQVAIVDDLAKTKAELTAIANS